MTRIGCHPCGCDRDSNDRYGRIVRHSGLAPPPLYSAAVKTTLVTLFQALADPTRLRLLTLMAASEVCVCSFVEVFDEPQPKISRHLAYLRRAGLVTARRDGKWIHYGLAEPSDPAVAEVLNKVLDVSSK